MMIALAVFGGIVWLIVTPGKPGKLDAFAKCIKDSGAKFYGAFWCPHCAAQKARFGKSADYLPYIECSNPDGQSQNQTCTDIGITTYPTWYFPTTTSPTATTTAYDVIKGEQELVDLANRTSCPLPA